MDSPLYVSKTETKALDIMTITRMDAIELIEDVCPILTRDKMCIRYRDKTLISNLNGLPTVYYNGTDTPRITGSVLPTDESGLLKIEWRDRETGESYQLATKLVGDYNLNNILAAITVGLHFDLDPKTINEALVNYQPHNERSQVLPPTCLLYTSYHQPQGK